jgi:hypothetical protein
MRNKLSRPLAFVAMIFAATGAIAGNPVYTGYLADETGLAYSKNYDVDLNNQGGGAVNELSMQATYSSTTLTTVAFTDGSKSTATITVTTNANLGVNLATNSVTFGSDAALAAQPAHATITIANNSALSGAYFVFNGAMFIEGRDWFKGATSSATAISAASALAGAPKIVVSTAGAGTVISATATLAGLVGNTYTLLSSTPTALSLSGTNFSGGTNDALLGAILTVNGQQLANGIAWNSFDPSTGVSVATRAALSLATTLNNVVGVAASASGSVVSATATIGGSAGNAFTMSSNRTGMVVSGPNFAGGRDTATITTDGISLRNGVDWTAGASSTLSALSVAAAINANATLNQVMVATNVGGVVYATSTITGTTANFSLSSLTSALTVSGFTGGGPTSINLTADTISVPNNNLTTALPVLYTKSAGTSPTPLVVGTTYYPIVVDANTFQLSYTSTGAIAGLPINITAQTATGGGSFLLSPSPLSGTAGFKWQESNDDANWIDVNVSSITFGSPYTAGDVFWDFGQVNMRWLRFKATGPTTGGVAIAVKANGKG